MITKEEIKLAFDKYDQADAEVDKAKVAYEQALKLRSDCVKAIFDATFSKGPYSHRGNQIKVVTRGDTWFFRGKSKDGVIEVD